LEKQREIDRLREEVQLLKAKLCQRQSKQQEGVFGSATPSSLKPLKASKTNRPKEAERRKVIPVTGVVPALPPKRMKSAGSN